jgi:NADPH2:quinone reductase
VVISGAGGVGSLAVQLGHAMGAGRVIATASSRRSARCASSSAPTPRSTARRRGSPSACWRPTPAHPVDVVFELAGGAVFDACKGALAPFGRMVAYGISSKEVNTVRTGSLLKRSHSVIGFWLFHMLDRPAWIEGALADLFARTARGELRVVAGGEYPLERAREAQEALAARRTTGKVVLRMG